jgi:hypothetical protein
MERGLIGLHLDGPETLHAPEIMDAVHDGILSCRNV